LNKLLNYYTENVEETTGRGVRSNRGRGGHAFQLENALKPIVGEQTHKPKEGIPEDISENSMAPPKARSGKNGVISVFSFIDHINYQIFFRRKTQNLLRSCYDLRQCCLQLLQSPIFRWLQRLRGLGFLPMT
jgi:hypothetical protein